MTQGAVYLSRVIGCNKTRVKGVATNKEHPSECEGREEDLVLLAYMALIDIFCHCADILRM